MIDIVTAILVFTIIYGLGYYMSKMSKENKE